MNLREEEIVQKILRSLTPSNENKVNTIEKVIPLIKGIDREIQIGRLKAFKNSKLKDALPKVESSFKATVHKDKIMLTKSARTNGNLGEYAKHWVEIERSKDRKKKRWIYLKL